MLLYCHELYSGVAGFLDSREDLEKYGMGSLLVIKVKIKGIIESCGSLSPHSGKLG